MTEPVAARLLTAQEYLQLPDEGVPTELVRGRVVEMIQPDQRHGQLCSQVARILLTHADRYGLGHVVVNDTGIVTRRNPDSVRGADVAFYSLARIPFGPLPFGCPSIPPDLIFVVRALGQKLSSVYRRL